jgi:dipeptidyl aminopeptidase/acylaminoacyl peptidase
MNKSLVLIWLGVIFLIACEKGEKESTFSTYTIEQFYASTSVGGGSFSPDEKKLLIGTDETGIFNLYEIDLASGEKTQVTNSTEESFRPLSYVPSTGEMLYSADKGGNEIDHIFLIQENGEHRDLTPGEEAKADFGGWSKDQTAFYYGSNKRDPKFFDLYKMNISDWSSEMLYENKDGLDPGSLSDDEQWLTQSQSITTSSNRLFLLNLNTGERIEISKPDVSAEYRASGFSKDGTKLYYTSNAEGEFTKLYSYDIESGEHAVEYEAQWDVMFSYLSKQGTYRVTGINEDGKTNLVLSNAQTGAAIDFPAIPDGDVLAVNISDSEKLMRLTVGSSRAPANISLYNFETKELKQLTNTLNPEISASNLVSAEVVRFPSFDSLDIPAIYYKPRQASASNKVPALVWVHGGPGGQSRQSYFALIQYLVNHGYAILAVNNRGSSGYGKTFNRMDDRDHGGADLQDCIWGKKWLAEQEYIDEYRIGIIGGSYGGYLTMAAMAFEPTEFRVGVNIFGVTNWMRTLKSIPPWWSSFREALYMEMGDPFSADSVRLHNMSPLLHAEQIQNPVMVLQGANDPRVLQIESDEMVEAIRENNVPVEYVIFPDEGHGFVKKDNQIKGYSQIRLFLDKYLKENSR